MRIVLLPFFCMLTMSFLSDRAFAFEIDTDTETNSDDPSRFSDPDDNMPFPYLSDDGQPSTSSPLQPVGHPGHSLGIDTTHRDSDEFRPLTTYGDRPPL